PLLAADRQTAQAGGPSGRRRHATAVAEPADVTSEDKLREQSLQISAPARINVRGVRCLHPSKGARRMMTQSFRCAAVGLVAVSSTVLWAAAPEGVEKTAANLEQRAEPMEEVLS